LTCICDCDCLASAPPSDAISWCTAPALGSAEQGSPVAPGPCSCLPCTTGKAVLDVGIRQRAPASHVQLAMVETSASILVHNYMPSGPKLRYNPPQARGPTRQIMR
jgi:hypothetical protein